MAVSTTKFKGQEANVAATRERREIPFARPLIGDEEKKAVLEVLSGPTLVHGPKSHQFEADFAALTGAPYAVSVSSCTAGMHLVYEAWGITEGDEVIVPAQTHTATAHAVIMAGGTPVFVDAESMIGNIDIDQIEAAITPHTKAIVVVHYLGVPVDMEAVTAIARKYNLKVLEDCALSLGATYNGQHTGLLGDAGCFSFYPVKHMTTAEGGMVITKDQSLATRVTRTRAFGVDKTPAERAEPGMYDVTMHGYNYRMNEIEAAIGVEQLKKVPGWLRKRLQHAQMLRQLLSDVPGVRQLGPNPFDVGGAAYCHSIILEDDSMSRAEVVEELKARGVGTSVYYPRPVPHMSYYREKFGYTLDTFPVAAHISARSIALPVGPHLSDDDVGYIAEQVRAVCSVTTTSSSSLESRQRLS